MFGCFSERGGGKEESEGVGGGGSKERGEEREGRREREERRRRRRKETVWIYTSCQIDMVTSERQTDGQTRRQTNVVIEVSSPSRSSAKGLYEEGL